MTQTSNLWLYFFVISGVIILPGLDMAFIMNCSIKGGYRPGFSAVGGTVVGGVMHMIIGATGLAAVLTLIPWAYTTMLIAGAGYIAWLGWVLIRANGLELASSSQGATSARHSFLGALATSMLNPKAYVFMLAIFPQFIRRDASSVWTQTASLSLITAATQIAIYGTIAVMAVRARHVLANKPHTNAILAKSIGVILICAAGMSLVGGLAQR